MTSTTQAVSSRSGLVRFLAALLPWIVSGIGIAGVTLLLMFLAGVFHKKVPEVAPERGRAAPADVVLAEVQLIERPRFETAVGTIKPIHEAAVAPKILAKVSEVNVSAGQQVTAGDVLVRLSDEDLQSRLKQAEAQRDSANAHVQQAKADMARAQQLVRANAISQAEYEAAETVVRTSSAELERASRAIDEANVFLNYATITAPFSGIVVDKQVEPGDTVSPGQTLLTLYDPTQMQLVANVRESLAMNLKVGQQVSAKLEAFDHECLATVREVVPEADVGSRSFQVKVSGPCPAGIYSGMFGRLQLPLGKEQLIVIPKTALRQVGQLTLVDVVANDRMLRRSVQLGRTLQDQVEVLSGLVPGEKVVVRSEGTR